MAEYFMPSRGSSYLNNVYTWLKTGKRFRPSFPRAVEFQTLSTCNAKCVFCPHSHAPERIPHGRMEDGLIKKIVDECSHQLVGRISPYLTNEPLLEKRMPDILTYIHQKVPFFTKTKINTNASLLTEDMGRKLIASGLNQLWISVNGYSQETYKESMGLDYEKTMNNIDTFLELKERTGKRNPSVRITTVHTKLVEHELPYAKEYWGKRKVQFSIHPLDNRAGDEAASALSARKKQARHCDLFLKQAYIVENGDMILCCHDWEQTVVLGNVAEKSIKEVWNSPSFIDRIYEYYEGNFDKIEICRNCNYL